jgi:O-antigen ligase
VVLDFSESHYGIAWKSALDIFADYPLFGVGVLNFRKVCPDEKYGPAEVGEKNYSRCTNHTHNIYFEWLVEGGMIGFAGIMLFAFFVLREFLRILPSQKHNLVFIALAASAAMRLFPLSSSASFHSNWSAIPMWLAIGWALAYGTDRAEKSNA